MLCHADLQRGTVCVPFEGSHWVIDEGNDLEFMAIRLGYGRIRGELDQSGVCVVDDSHIVPGVVRRMIGFR